MMLPTDMALVIEDESFKTYMAEAYTTNEALFQKDFTKAFGQLISLGCPAHCQPGAAGKLDTNKSKIGHARIRRTHEGLARQQNKQTNKKLDVNATKTYSKCTALNKAAYFGHANVIEYLIGIEGCDVNAKDANGDTPLQDAVHHGHTEAITLLLQAGANKSVQNPEGKTALDLVYAQENPDICSLLLVAK
jgi:ankyrin repeat protein